METHGWHQRFGGSVGSLPVVRRSTTGWNGVSERGVPERSEGTVFAGNGGYFRAFYWLAEAPSGTASSSGSSASTPQGDAFWNDEDPGAKRRRVEAVLLLSKGPVPSRKLSQLAGLADATEARTLVRRINQLYTEQGRAFRVEDVAGGYQLMTRPAVAPWLRRLGHIPKTIQLTPPAMETIAIVAYRQPVLRADIEAIRGVSCGEILRQLMDRDLVRISGRSEELGRPYLYSTTKHFLQTFGLRGTDALPALDVSEIEISDDPDWRTDTSSADPSRDQQPVSSALEEESDVSTAVANFVLDDIQGDEQAALALALENATVDPQNAMDEDDDDVYVDDDDEDDFGDDDDDDDDWDDEEGEDEDLDDDDDEEEVEEEDADWEEVEDDWDEEGDEEDDLEEEDDDLEEDDDWDDDEDDDGLEEDDEEDEEWD